MFFWRSSLTKNQLQMERLHARIRQKTNFFPGQRASEEVQLVIRTHWLQRAKIVLWLFLLGIILPGLIFYFFTSMGFRGKSWVILGLVEVFYLLLAWLLTLIEFIKSEFTVVVVTNERVVDITQKSIFDREIAETNLERIQEVAGQTNGFWRTFFDIGKLEIQTAGSDVPLLMSFVKSPQFTARKILDIQRASQNRRRASDFAKRADDKIAGRVGENLSAEELKKMRSGSTPSRKSNGSL